MPNTLVTTRRQLNRFSLTSAVTKTKPCKINLIFQSILIEFNLSVLYDLHRQLAVCFSLEISAGVVR